MLNHTMAGQRGVILVVTLVALAAMTLAGVALMRSTDTAGLIVGNLTFQESVTLSADAGVEAAIEWLEANKGGATLHVSNQPVGYSAIPYRSPDPAETWGEYWDDALAPVAFVLPEDVAGNTAAYAIERLCYGASGVSAEGLGPGQSLAGCPTPPIGNTSNSGMGAGALNPAQNKGQVYYRITVRIEGPRETVNYVQAIVAL